MQQENYRRIRIAGLSVKDLDTIRFDFADGHRRHGVAGLCALCCCLRSPITHNFHGPPSYGVPRRRVRIGEIFFCCG